MGCGVTRAGWLAGMWWRVATRRSSSDVAVMRCVVEKEICSRREEIERIVVAE